uniref:Uncharacterized protein n=1 Tax=Glossina pallidipes TaxID=7398 RepID=A0A1B0ADG0_GLOPL
MNFSFLGVGSNQTHRSLNNNLATNAHTLQFNGGNTNTANSILASTAGSNTVSSSTVTTGLGVNNPAVTAQATRGTEKLRFANSACMEAFDSASLALLLIGPNVRPKIYDPVLRASDGLSPPTALISFKRQVVRCNKQFTPTACIGDPKSAATQT